VRFLADQCVPRSVIEALQGAGHEVLKLGDIIPSDSPDWLVISKAQELDAVLLSLNGDFADIVTYPQPGIRASCHFRSETTPKPFHGLWRGCWPIIGA